MFAERRYSRHQDDVQPDADMTDGLLSSNDHAGRMLIAKYLIYCRAKLRHGALGNCNRKQTKHQRVFVFSLVASSLCRLSVFRYAHNGNPRCRKMQTLLC